MPKKTKAEKNAAKAAKQEKKALKKEANAKKKQEKQEAKAQKQKLKKQKQAEKAAAKKQKAAVKKEKAAAKKQKAAGEKKEKKLNLKLVLLMLPVLLVAVGGATYFLSPDVFGKEDLPAPEAYVIGEESTIVLDKFLTEGGKLAAIKDLTPEAEAGEEEAEEAPASAVNFDRVLLYEYKGVTPAALQGYVDALLADEGFVAVDEEYNELETLPEFSKASEDEEAEAALVEGSLRLAREAETEGRLFQLLLNWTAKGECSIEVSCPLASFPAEELMNLSATMDYIRTLSPGVLGLEGGSMSEYRVYPQDQGVLVDGKVCRKFTVYDVNETTGTNSFIGAYMISGSGRHLYKLDPLSGEIEQLY